MLDDGYYLSQIAKLTGESKSHIFYYIKSLEDAGYIKQNERIELVKPGEYTKKSRGVIKLYHLTQAGSNFLERMESNDVVRCLRLHNIYWKYLIIEQPEIDINWKRVEMNNWEQLVGSELGLSVRKNPKSIEVITKAIDGHNPYELLFRSRDEADRLANHLEAKFRMLLGRPTLSRRPHFAIWDPVANVVVKNFQFSTDIAKIDESKGFGEIDWLDPYSVDKYLRMPDKIDRIEEIVLGNRGMIERFVKKFESNEVFE